LTHKALYETLTSQSRFNQKNTMKTYRIQSTNWCYSPGIIKFAQAMFWTDPSNAVRILRDGLNLPAPIAEGLACGSIEYSVDGEVAVISVEAL
jgi:hypothetical protein